MKERWGEFEKCKLRNVPPSAMDFGLSSAAKHDEAGGGRKR